MGTVKGGTIGLIVILALGLLAVPLSAESQKPGKVYRIGFLMVSTSADASFLVETFLQGMRDRGWVEEQHFVMVYRWAEGQFTRLPALATDLVQAEVDLIVTGTTQAALAAKQATQTIPIVMAAIGDPIGAGLVADLAQPGGDLTGMALLAPEVAGKQLELLTQTVPNVSRVALLWNPTNPLGAIQLREAKVAAQALGVQLLPVAAGSPGEFDRAFEAMRQARAEALLVTAAALFYLHRTRIQDLAAQSQLPTMYGLPGQAKPDGLMAYSANLPDLYRRIATYVVKIFNGRRPANLPIQQPVKFDFVINLKTAKTLGITIPPSILFQADEVIR